MKKIVIKDKTLITEKMLPEMIAVIDTLNEAVDMGSITLIFEGDTLTDMEFSKSALGILVFLDPEHLEELRATFLKLLTSVAYYSEIGALGTNNERSEKYVN